MFNIFDIIICISVSFQANGFFVLKIILDKGVTKMKKALIGIIATIMAVITMFSLTACQNRTKKDLSKATSVADLAGAKISAQAGTFHVTARNQIKDVKGDIYPDFDSLLTALLSGAIDGYIAEEPTAFSVCLKNSNLDYVRLVNNDTGFTATDDDVSIAIGVAKGSALLEKINTAIRQTTAEQRKTLMEQIVRIRNTDEKITNFAVSNSAPETTTETLRVAMECAYDPFNWSQESAENGAVPIKDKKNLYANGYDVQIAKFIANALGMELEIHMVEWDSLISGVKAGTFDAIIAGMSPTAERRAEVDFTDVYYTSNLVVIYKK